jgi:chromosome segregation ATPase
MQPAMTTDPRSRSIWISGLSALFLVMVGCMAQQADLKKTEQTLQTRIAQQKQELAVLREQELPQLRGELERALQQARELQARQDDLKHRSLQLEQQTKKLEQLAGTLEMNKRGTELPPQVRGEDEKHLLERLDSIDELISSLLVQVEELKRRVQALEKR